VIVCDTSGLVAAYSAPDRRRDRIVDLVSSEPDALILSPFVLAELDYLIGTRASVRDEMKVLSDVAAGVYTLAEFGPDDVRQAAELVERYESMRIGITDASLVVLAARYATTRILTLDERHFRAIRPLRGDAFTILPADS
jgi:predicted nucleic acid-binding protein